MIPKLQGASGHVAFLVSSLRLTSVDRLGFPIESPIYSRVYGLGSTPQYIQG